MNPENIFADEAEGHQTVGQDAHYMAIGNLIVFAEKVDCPKQKVVVCPIVAKKEDQSVCMNWTY